MIFKQLHYWNIIHRCIELLTIARNVYLAFVVEIILQKIWENYEDKVKYRNIE